MKVLHSVNDYNEAKQVIAGGVNSPVRAFKSVGGTPRFITSGKGSYFYDVDGNAYLDFIQSWGPLIFGHADPDVIKVSFEVIQNGISFGAPTELETTLAKEIIAVYEGLEKIRLVSSGTEATMSAIRLTRAYTGKDNIIKFDGCYHGHSDSLLVSAGSGCVTFGSPSSPGVPQDFAKHTLVARYNDLDSLKACFAQGDIAGVIIEPIAGNMGLIPADFNFLSALRELCDQYGALLIFDEVMSGFRSSLSGSQKYYNIVPDLATFGKVIGGGMPLAAFGGRDDIMKLLSPVGSVYQAGTLSGNPVAVSAGLMTVCKIKSDPTLYDRLETLALSLMEGFKREAQNYQIPLQTCVCGSMFGYFFCNHPVKNFDDAQKSNLKLFAKFHQKMLDRGIYLAPSAFETGFICATMTQEDIEFAIKKCGEVFQEIVCE